MIFVTFFFRLNGVVFRQMYNIRKIFRCLIYNKTQLGTKWYLRQILILWKQKLVYSILACIIVAFVTARINKLATFGWLIKISNIALQVLRI